MGINRKGTLSIFIGLLLMAAAFILTIYNIWDAGRAKKASDEIVEKLEAILPDGKPGILEYGDADWELPTEVIDGYCYIGILQIPGLDLCLPVMEVWDYERLKISPCRYNGSCFTDDMVICAHNYAKHFGSIRWMDIGDDIYFITVEGQAYHYQVSNLETVRPTAIEEMIDSSASDWNLTLFTCNADGQTRCAVRCVRVL